MKLTRKEVERMRELNVKASADRTQNENEELSALLMKATDNGDDISKLLAPDFDVDAHFKNARSVDLNDDDSLTADAVKNLVFDSVTEAVKDKGVTEEVVKTLTDRLDKLETVKPDDIKSAIAEALGGNGNDVDIKNAIEEGMKSFKPSDSVSKEDFEAAIADLKKSFENKGSRNQFSKSAGVGYTPDGVVVEFPTEHRAGNLNVAEKQLLNIMMNATPGLKEHQIQAIQNDGIAESTLKHAASSGHRQVESLRKSILYGEKTLVTGTSNQGAELIATDLSSELLNRMYLDSPLASEFISSEIDMPTPSFQLPIRTTRPTFYKGSENPGSNPTESSPGTDNVTLTAQKLIGRTNFSYEAEEDAVVPVLGMVTENLASAAADALEDAIVNGDTAGTHQDSDATASGSMTLFNGIRKLALGGSLDRSLSTGGISDTNILTLKKDMGRWGIRPNELLILCGVKGYADFIGLAETLTADLTGNAATARLSSGLAPTLYGSKIVVSSRIREDLNASGVHDGVTETKGSIYIVHRPSWIMGVRKGFTVEIDRDVQQQVNIVVASFRRDFKPMETPSASLPYAVMGRDYDA
jgi:HK97 family phage major capsid protein